MHPMKIFYLPSLTSNYHGLKNWPSNDSQMFTFNVSIAQISCWRSRRIGAKKGMNKLFNISCSGMRQLFDRESCTYTYLLYDKISRWVLHLHQPSLGLLEDTKLYLLYDIQDINVSPAPTTFPILRITKLPAFRSFMPWACLLLVD